MTKDERQSIGINKFLKAGGIGAWDYFMRFGKTLGALKVAKRFNVKFPNDNIIILVPSVAIKDVWNKELSNFPINNIILLTADEISKDRDITTKCGLLIVDELHKFITPIRKAVLDHIIISKFRLGLTGTYPYDDDFMCEKFPVVDTICEKEAVDNKWVAPSIEINIPLEMSDADKAEYVSYSTVMYNELRDFKGLQNILQLPNGQSFFTSDLDLILSCYSGKSVTGHGRIKSHYIREAVAQRMGWTPELELNTDYNKQLDEYWNPENIKDRVSSFYRAMTARNYIHNVNEVKLDAVLQLYSLFKDDVIITFSESTIFADMITDSINNTFNCKKAVSYHSNIESKPLVNFIDNEYFKTKDGKLKLFGKTRQLKYILSMLELKVFNCINTVRALDEGLSVDKINIVISTSGTVNPRQYKQRSARGKTIDVFNPNKVTIIINLYFDDFMFMVGSTFKHFKSRDKTKLKLRQNDRHVKESSLSKIIENNH